jgi:integrase
LPKGAGKKDAERKETELRKSLETQRFSADPPLTEIMSLYMEHSDHLRSEDTAKHHAARIAPYIAGKKASEAKLAAARIIMGLKGEGYATATINRSLGTLKKALSIAKDKGIIETNYGDQIKRQKENNQREVFLTVEEVEKIANKASESVRTAIWIALYTGMRRGEILKLRPEHIRNGIITIPAGNTKTLKMRSLPVIEELKPWLEKIPLGITFEGLKTGFQRARKAAGMEHVNFHDLRHATASMLAANGFDLHLIGKQLGHTTTKTTERYAHLKIEQQREAMEKVFGKK